MYDISEQQRTELILIIGFMIGIKKMLTDTQKKDLETFVIQPLERITNVEVRRQ